MSTITTPTTITEAISQWPHLYECHGYQPSVAAHFDSIFEAEVRAAAPALGLVAVMGARLAISHGHGYASAAPGPWATVWAILNGWPQAWDSLISKDFPSLGPSSALSHITGSGRLRWEVRGDSLLIVVARPDGDVLRAWVRNDGTVVAHADGRTPFHTYHVDVFEFAVATALAGPWVADDEIKFGATPRDGKVEEVIEAWGDEEGPMFEDLEAPEGVTFAEYATEVFRAVGNMYGYWIIHLGPSFEASRSTLGYAGRALAAGYEPVEVLEAMRKWEANP